MRADEEGNMNGKMTDEELEQALESMLKGFMQARRKVRAHIAALTAELGEARTNSDDYRHGCEELTRERDALRERVQTLEAESARETERGDRWKGSADTAESRLAAIRRRAGDVGGFFRASGGVGAPGWLERGLGFVLGDDVRPSAPPEAFTHEKGLDAGVFDEAPQPNARVIAYEGNQPIVLATMPPKLEGPLDSPADMIDEAPLNPDATSEADQSIPEVTLEIAGLAEPTTSEAFRRLRDLAHGDWTQVDHADVERADRDISLLERRMGAMEKAVEAAQSGEMVKASRLSALTGAPPVFTLEEICTAMERTAIHAPVQRDVVAALAAMRRKP